MALPIDLITAVFRLARRPLTHATESPCLGMKVIEQIKFQRIITTRQWRDTGIGSVNYSSRSLVRPRSPDTRQLKGLCCEL